MDINKIIEEVRSPEYDFLKTEKNLGDNVILLTMGGSVAYGTDHEGSDVDLRGIAMLRPENMIMQNDWQSYRSENTDTVIYSLQHAIEMLSVCNPNTIELLGCKPEHNIYMSQFGKELIENRHMFLSQIAIDSFCGYASKQFQRMENQMMHREEPDRTQINLIRTIQRSYAALKDRFSKVPESAFELYLDDAVHNVPGLTKEVFIDLNVKRLPLTDVNDLFNFLRNIEKDYTKSSQRNEKALKHDKINKHCEHLLRLYMMGIDILEKEEIITYREGSDHDLLMAVLNKEFFGENGLPNKDFYILLEDYKNKFYKAIEKTKLPMNPDYNKIQNWTVKVCKEYVSRKDL